MSQDVAGQAAQPGNGQATINEVAKFFRQAGEMRSQPRLRGITGVCRFDIAGAGRWSVAVNDSEVTVIEEVGNALRADCVLSCSAEDFRRILHGDNHMNLITAAMQGLVNVTGDTVFAMALLGNVIAAPVAASGRR
jgi:SCP-2 sterol transfer family protein